MSGTVKTISQSGDEGQHDKEAPYEERAALLVCRAILFIRQTVFFSLGIKGVLISTKQGLPCACQVLPMAMCDCVTLSDMCRTGLDCF